MAFLNNAGLERLWAHIISKLNKKVDKVDGKGLSTEDFTTEEKEKLAAIQEDGNVKSVNGNTPDENGNVHIEPELPNPKDIPVIGVSGSEGEYGKFLTVTSRNAQLEWGLDGDIVRFSDDIYSAERPDVLKMGYTRYNDALAYTTRNKKILTLPRTISIDGKVYEPTDDGEIVLPSAYTFPSASKTEKGSVVIGDGIEVDDGGRISVPLASNDGPAGLVAPGKGLEANYGTLKVRYDEFVATREEQSLTEQEQARARENIGAADAADVERLNEEIDGINERLPEINEDGETHKLLEDTDIDDTLSVPGKVADAGAVGAAIYAIDGQYELIESVTLSEDTAFRREAEPDGTPYAFDAVMVRLTTSGNQTGTNAVIMFDDKSSSLNGAAWLASLNNNTEKKRAFVWCEKCRGMWHMNLRPFVSVQAVAKLESDILHHNAKKIVGVVFTGTLSAGVTVDIYGVRAKDVSA